MYTNQSVDTLRRRWRYAKQTSFKQLPDAMRQAMTEACKYVRTDPDTKPVNIHWTLKALKYALMAIAGLGVTAAVFFAGGYFTLWLIALWRDWR